MSWLRSQLVLLAAVVATASGCTSLWNRDSAVPASSLSHAPGKHAMRVSQFVFYSEFPLKEQGPLLQELSVLRDRLHRDLKLPPSTSIVQVFLFEDQARYESYMKLRYPDLPRRRAFFIAQPAAGGGAEDLFVFTYWGDNIRQDLRHELTHAILHASLRDVPLWLDEGLAEYYELPPDQNGINAGHVELLKAGPFEPNLSRLELLTDVKHMERAEYRESWAWVHFLFHGLPEGKKALLDYLHATRKNGAAGPSLSSTLCEIRPLLNDDLRKYLSSLQAPAPKK
jgi:hypothetical protein